MFTEEQIDAIEDLSSELLRYGVKHSQWEKTSGSNDFAPSIEIFEGDTDIQVFAPVPEEKYDGYLIQTFDGDIIADDVDLDTVVGLLVEYKTWGWEAFNY